MGNSPTESSGIFEWGTSAFLHYTNAIASVLCGEDYGQRNQQSNAHWQPWARSRNSDMRKVEARLQGSVLPHPSPGETKLRAKCRNVPSGTTLFVLRGLAEIAGEYLRKGSKVYIEGSLRTSSWEADGQKKYRTEVNARELQMLDSRGGGESGMGGRQWRKYGWLIKSRLRQIRQRKVGRPVGLKTSLTLSLRR